MKTLFFSFFSFLIGILFEYYNATVITAIPHEVHYTRDTCIKEDVFFTYEDVYLELRDSLPDSIAFLAASISILESGWGTNSSLAINANNIFGMDNTGSVHTRGSYGRHSNYPTYTDAIKDFIRWYKISPIQAGETKIAWLKRRGYNPYPSYYIRLQEVMDKLAQN